MTLRPTTLERAFQLAEEGDCRTIPEIERKLQDEGYPRGQLQGDTLRAQLRGLLRGALRQA
jgi:hypothetical protein